MNDTLHGIGHNSPPDPLDAVIAIYDADRAEAEGWLDGKLVESDGQMKAVDTLTVTMKASKKAFEDAKEDEYRPHKVQCDAIVAKYKPTLEDQDRIIKGLVALVSGWKGKVAAEVREKERLAYEARDRLQREAEEKARTADAGNIEQQREAAAAKQAVIDADNVARKVYKEAPKGMRTVPKHEIIDLRALVNWIATNDKDAMAAFATEYARKNNADIPDAIVRSWKEKEAF